MRKQSMRTVNAGHESTKKNTAWVFLAEYSLDELMRMAESGGEPAEGILFQDLGIPQELLNPMMQTLATFAQQALTHAHPGALLAIRVFCQEKMLMTGGWGYFLVERSGDIPEDRPGISPNLIDLYLYKEGK